MDTYTAIMTRRSVAKMRADAPPKEDIARLLDAGVRAPCHRLTQPWRFVILRGDALDEFAQAWIDGFTREGKDYSDVPAKCARAPVIICVIERPHTHNPKVVEVEEHHATGAAMQNILLAAHDMGLGAMLRTGPAAQLPEVRRYLGMSEGEFVAGFIYVGYPQEGDEARPMTRRTEPAELTKWRGWK